MLEAVLLAVALTGSEARDYNRAVVIYNRAEYPGQAAPCLTNAATQWSTNHTKAENAISDYLRRWGTNARGMAFVLMGELRRRAGDHCGSIDWYQEGMRRSARRYVWHHGGVNLLYACLRCGETNVAMAERVAGELLEREALATNTDVLAAVAIVYVRLGHQAYNETDWVQAAIRYTAARTLQPSWPGAGRMLGLTLIRMGECYEMQGEVEGAAGFYARALEILNDPLYDEYKTGKMAAARELAARKAKGAKAWKRND